MPVAVLIRALEPREGIEVIRANRSVRPRKQPLPDRDLCSGPARLCQALAIDRHLNHTDLTASDTLFVEAGDTYQPRQVVRTTRVGIAYAEDWVNKPLRWYVRRNPHISVPARD